MPRTNIEMINDLTESRLIPTRNNLSKFTARDVADLVFLYLCALKLLASEFDHMAFAASYARSTLRHGNFSEFKSGATDLYILIVSLNDDETSKKLKDQENSGILLNRVQIPEQDIKRFLRNIQRNQEDISFDRRFLQSLQRDLNITESNYRSIRRLVEDWNTGNLDDDAKKLVMTRLLQAFRARAKKSELLSVLEKLSKTKHYELKGKNICDPETGNNCGSSEKKSSLSKFVTGLTAAGIGGYLGHKFAQKESAEPLIVNTLKIENKDDNNKLDEIADKVYSLLETTLSDENVKYGSYTMIIDKAIIQVAEDFKVSEIEAIRAFTEKFGHDPVMFFEVNMNNDHVTDYDDSEFEKYSIENIWKGITGKKLRETTTAGSVASMAGGLGAGDPKASIYYNGKRTEKSKPIIIRRGKEPRRKKIAKKK